MTVRQFLGRYNLGRSVPQQATVVCTDYEDTYTFSRRELHEDAYGSRGDLKVSSFTITTDNIVIYAHH